MKLEFEKVHGCGNDFVIINNLDNSIELSKEQVANLCDRHFGIGADGLILVEKRDGNYYMNYYNSDGSFAEMCGNGMRCTGEFISRNIEDKDAFDIKSATGMHHIKADEQITISLPKATFFDVDQDQLKQELNKVLDFKVKTGFVSMGNPHMVILVDSLDDVDIDTIGPFFEKNDLFENGINVNFVSINDSDEVEVITWERGDGRTLACGTGACASVSFLNQLNLIEPKTRVKLPGGMIELEILDDSILMTGPAQKVFSGQIEV